MAVATGEKLGMSKAFVNPSTNTKQMFDTCVRKRDEVGQISVEAKDCLDTLRENHMKQVFERAKMADFENEDIRSIQNLIENTPEQKFMQQQLRACSRHKVHMNV